MQLVVLVRPGVLAVATGHAIGTAHQSHQAVPDPGPQRPAKALAAQGVDVVGFVAGEPDFDTPEFIKQAAVDAMKAGFTKYTPTAGIPELREAICDKLQRDNQLTYAPDQVLVSVGAKHSLYNIFQALLNEGDEVIILSPYWVSYPDMVLLAGGRPGHRGDARGERLRAGSGGHPPRAHPAHAGHHAQQPQQPHAAPCSRGPRWRASPRRCAGTTA